ncbi:helix-turn-helix transcriptional regulator [Rhodococcus sp. WB9]|uniref:winged helix-turn-helix transcriptional regulator n=1 Tax=Rhodococcus sp. WB9 TaxID=2594007 RepID=UPI0011853A2E|nr:helix-turn-helix domain-containing protein [Rhodococcus sp. WB9]QDQ95396.1 helix-turn-helix transcriptional regulator [Rhodococcus sp. WB9]
MSSQVRPCSVARTLELVGAKWTLLVVREMLLGNHRFDEIARYTGAPRDTLTARLRKLESEGLVTRVQYEQRPPRFEYHLTALGRSLGPIVATMREFGDRHLTAQADTPMVLQHTAFTPLRFSKRISAGEELDGDGDELVVELKDPAVPGIGVNDQF